MQAKHARQARDAAAVDRGQAVKQGSEGWFDLAVPSKTYH